jgi:peptidyl-prolyl cis-trans isomerase C
MLRAAATAAALALAACAHTPVSEMVLARVNGEPVTVAELNEAFDSSHRGHGVLLAGQGAVREFLDQVIDRRLLIQEGRRIGAEEDPALQKARAALKAKRAAEGFLADEVTRKVVVHESRVAVAYSRLGERFAARHLLAATREEAERALARVRGGEEFGAVARQVSLAETASRGGDLGIVQWGRLEPAMEEVLWGLRAGDTSEPFRTEEGWNLLHVMDRVSEELPRFGMVEGRLKGILTQRASRGLAGALFRRLLRESGATMNEEPLAAALAAPPGRGPAGDTVLARVGAEAITLERALTLVDATAARRLSAFRLRQQARLLLEGEVFRLLLEREGLKRGYGDRPAVVKELDRLTDEGVYQHLLGNVVLPRGEVGAAEVEAYYRSHAKQFTEAEALRLSAIVVEREDEAQEIVRALAGGADWRALARTRSKDPSAAAAAGEIPGWITRGKLEPALEQVAFSLWKEGALAVARVPAGYVVVRLDKRRLERLKPLEEVKEEALKGARRERARQAVKLWVAKLKQASTVEVDEEAIGRAIASYEAEAAAKAKKAERADKPHGGRGMHPQ